MAQASYGTKNIFYQLKLLYDAKGDAKGGGFTQISVSYK